MLSCFLQRSLLDRKWQLSYSGAMATSKVIDPNCSIARSLGVLGERWTFLILREAMDGVTRFAEFRDALGIAPDVLADRLTTLVEYGVMSRAPYQEPGSRTRFAYKLTPAGEELHVALGSLQQWGDAHLPRADGPTIERRARKTNRPVHVGFIDDRGREVAANDVATIRTSAYPRSIPR
ncbi:MAG: transcriptional regulator [Mycobacterium sp.]|jgi:DNA-binding HxlR family transcriptional regulator|nr:transcriptional regulator [Mycobacterium sp.]